MPIGNEINRIAHVEKDKEDFPEEGDEEEDESEDSDGDEGTDKEMLGLLKSCSWALDKNPDGVSTLSQQSKAMLAQSKSAKSSSQAPKKGPVSSGSAASSSKAPSKGPVSTKRPAKASSSQAPKKHHGD